jgi:hypothetical protein
VFEALQVSMKTLELISVAPVCWRLIEERTRELFEYHMESLDSHTLARILDRDQLNLKETELYQFLVK